MLYVNELCVKLSSGKIIVENISFSLKRGEVLAVIGESGSGKTITCKAILGLLSNEIFKISGKIMFNGRDILNIPETKKRDIRGKDICLIMQNPQTAFNPLLKIGGHISETLLAHTNMTPEEAYIAGITVLRKVGLRNVEEIMNSYSYTLSGGMLQRIMIGISMLLKPSVIIADEPTTALDVKNQKMVLAEFQRIIKEENIGLIIVTHDFGVVARMANQVILMKNGELIEGGPLNKVMKEPEHPYTRELLDAHLLREF